MKNWSYTIKEEGHTHFGETLFSGCYTTCEAYIIATLPNNEKYILANKRGSGAADNQGKWNVPSGYREADETAIYTCARETLEETGFYISPDKFCLLAVNTNPELANHGNTELLYIAHIMTNTLPNLHYENINGEVDEVENAKWIPLDKIDNYEWSFYQDKAIKDLIIGNGHRF